jgi:hypothetical protein
MSGLANPAVDRTAGSHSLAAAGHRERYADIEPATVPKKLRPRRTSNAENAAV